LDTYALVLVAEYREREFAANISPCTDITRDLNFRAWRLMGNFKIPFIIQILP